MKKIQLSQCRYALVDDEDFDLLNKWKWSYGGNGYAVRFKYIGKINGKRKNESIYLHRFLLGFPKKMEVDHIDRNKLNNQRKNLRKVSKGINCFNKNLLLRNTSGHTGVGWFKRIKKWRSRIVVNKKEISLGYFNDISSAILARKKAENTYYL